MSARTCPRPPPDRGAEQTAEVGAQPTRRAVRVDGQERRLAFGHVGEVDAGVGADEAVPGLGDEQLATATQDANRLGLDEALLGGGVLGIDGDELASALETIFWVTTTTSPSASAGPEGDAGARAAAMTAARSAPGVTSPMPSTGGWRAGRGSRAVTQRASSTAFATAAAATGESMMVGATTQRSPRLDGAGEGRVGAVDHERPTQGA